MNIPILFLVFNRPDNTKEVFEAIKQTKPQKLYIAADGPRQNKKGENELVNIVRKIVTQIDWPCELNTLFRDHNLGCKFAVSDAITWFFNQEDYGIILEDDCLPSSTFFRFCEEMLLKYEHNDKIMAISGTNITQNECLNSSYFFSKYALMWGWASWARAWKKYDVEMKSLPDFFNKDGLNKLNLGGKPFIKTWTSLLNRTYREEIDTWDYQWIYCCWLNNGLTIVPSVNLIKNIGFSSDATHTLFYDPIKTNLKIFNLDFPLKHPLIIKPNKSFDKFIGKYWFHATWKNIYKIKLLSIPIIMKLNLWVKSARMFIK